jgi:hypothetical protein
MPDSQPRRPSHVDPRGYERIGIPANPDPEVLAAARRLVGDYHPMTPERTEHLTDAELREAFLEAGFSDRAIAHEVLIARNIRRLYHLDHVPISESVEELVRAGDMNEPEWSICFQIPGGAIDAYLRQLCGETYDD